MNQQPGQPGFQNQQFNANPSFGFPPPAGGIANAPPPILNQGGFSSLPPPNYNQPPPFSRGGPSLTGMMQPGNANIVGSVPQWEKPP